jgi:GNAT superfamily N-acetyltransferase
MEPGEEGRIAELVLRTFAAASDEYDEQAVETFVQMVSPDTLAEIISDEDCFFFNAYDKEDLVGTIGVRNGNHIFLFFVDTKYQRKGIGRVLVGTAIAHIKQRYPSAREILVHSSRGAIVAYEHMGFRKIGKEVVQEGIVSTPMCKHV